MSPNEGKAAQWTSSLKSSEKLAAEPWGRLDRQILERLSCECYAAMVEQSKSLSR